MAETGNSKTGNCRIIPNVIMSKCWGCLLLMFIGLGPCNLLAQSGQLSREKLYIQTDKSAYLTGDTLWFKSYLVDALMQTPSLKSGIEYVELINQNKKVVKRLALHVLLGTAFGEIPIDDNFVTGKFILRAYTNWMQNFGDSLFFQKEITINNLADKQYISSLPPEISQMGDKTEVKLHFLFKDQNQQALPMLPVKFYVTDDKNNVLLTEALQTGGMGQVLARFQLTKMQLQSPLHIKVGNNLDEIKADIALELGNRQEDQLDIRFLPESGHLVAGLSSTIGFKAIGLDGYGRDVSGVIKDQEGKEITKFKSFYKGMGRIQFTPALGEQYTAYLDSGRKIPLPVVENSGVSLHIEGPKVSADSDGYDENLKMTINGTPDLKGREFLLTATAKGLVIYKATAILKDGTVKVNVPKSIFPMGIVRFALTNNNALKICERSVFIDNHETLNITFDSPVGVQENNDSLPVTITVKNKEGKPVVGSFSMAITDTRFVDKVEARDQNILTYLLLQSDIQGHIETPGYYLNGKRDSTKLALDNLMLTQAFVRYNWDSTIFKYAPEPEFIISGRVTNAFKKGVPNAKVTLISTEKVTIIKETETDKNGKFVFKDFPAFDTTRFMLRTQRQKGSQFGLAIEPDTFSFAKHDFISFAAPPMQAIYTDSALWMSIKDKLSYNRAVLKQNGGLPDVTVRANRGIPNSYNLNGTGNADQVIGPNEIRMSAGDDLYDLMLKKVKDFGISAYNSAEKDDKHPKKIVTPDGFMKNLGGSNQATKRISMTSTLAIGNATYLIIIIDGKPMKYFLEDIDFGNTGPDALLHNQIDFLREFPATDIKGIEVLTSYKYIKKYLAKFNNNEWMLNGTLKVVFVEVTTYSGHGPLPKAVAGRAFSYPPPFHYGKSIYVPKYLVMENESLPAFPRTTVYWNANIITGTDGKAIIYYYPGKNKSSYSFWLEGMDMEGSIGVYIKEPHDK